MNWLAVSFTDSGIVMNFSTSGAMYFLNHINSSACIFFPNAQSSADIPAQKIDRSFKPPLTAAVNFSISPLTDLKKTLFVF